MKHKGKVTDGIAEVVPSVPVPRHDFVEFGESAQRRRIHQPHQIQPRIGDRLHAIREPHQRLYDGRHPHVGEISPYRFHRRKRQNAIADGAGTN